MTLTTLDALLLLSTRQPPYPLERRPLVTGVLDAAMQSHARAGQAIATPQLQIAYQPVDFRAFRENGATWKIITRDTPQPTGFEPGDAMHVKHRG